LEEDLRRCSSVTAHNRCDASGIQGSEGGRGRRKRTEKRKERREEEEKNAASERTTERGDGVGMGVTK
jgi:hypothetical protein